MNFQNVKDLRGLLGERFSQKHSELEQHSYDESAHKAQLPWGVCYPNNEEEIIEIVRYCNQAKIPVFPYGAGTSIEGQVIPYHGGISINLSNLNKILVINVDDQDCVVEAGVRKNQLNDVLKSKALFFPAGPAIDPSIGGMASTRASGLNAVRYGTMRENIHSLKFISPTGDLVQTGARSRKSSAGYDLTHLLIGAEGTLGIITELTLKLSPLPQHIVNATVHFAQLEAAVNTVIEILKTHIPIAVIELMDEVQIEAVNQYSSLNLKALPTLFIELHGAQKNLEIETQTLQKILLKQGGKKFTWADDPIQREKLWTARANCYYASLNLFPNYASITTDVCVPISRLVECIKATKADLSKTTLKAPLLGHVGDGNFHFLLLFDPNNSKSNQEAKWVHDRLIKRAIKMEGTCSGEHGIGVGKMAYLKEEKGVNAIQTMRLIKKALDPNNIMNPGKIF